MELYTDRIEISSPGGLPRGMTLSDFGRKSVRRNALIADLLHRIGFIEKAGTGIKRIRDEAREHGCPEPIFEETGFVTATFRPNPRVRAQAGSLEAGGAPEVTGEVTGEVLRLLAAMHGEMSRSEIQAALELRHEDHFRAAYLVPALSAKLIEMTLPDKPRSSKQRYRVTALGAAALEQTGKKA